ncbi:MAG: glycosyltransferase family protein, partial [Limisphaerales bacterium]
TCEQQSVSSELAHYQSVDALYSLMKLFKLKAPNGQALSMLIWIRNVVRWCLLRGPLLKVWIARKARKLDRAYCAELVRASALENPATTPNTSLVTGVPLRTILFIADCMWELNDLVPELRKIAAVSVLDLHLALNKKPSNQTDREAVTAAIRDFAAAQKNLAPDVVFFYARPAILSEATFEVLRRTWHCPLFGMSLDDKMEFLPYGIFSSGNDNYQHWAAKFDLNLTNCLAAVEWYQQRGLPCLYSPQGVHLTDDLSLPASADFKYEFSFLGSRKPEREIIINELLRFGIPIKLFGSGWPNGQWVDNPNAIYRGTQINLGIGLASPSLTLTTVKGRDFECPGVGACYLTTYNWELADFYELGREILCYRSVEELIEMHAFYRKRPEECLKIAQAAWRRCVAEHTWEQRFRKIFQQTGFKLLEPAKPNEPSRLL